MVDGPTWGPERASRRAKALEGETKRALVVGCAAAVWDEVIAATDLCDFHAVYCVKLAGVHWPGKFEVFVGLHPEFMDAYEAQRASLGLPDGYEIVAPLPGEVGMHSKKGNVMRRVSYRWPGMNASASSGIYAAKVALDDGFDRVVLAGIPMEREAGHFKRGKPWEQRDVFMNGFTKSIPHLIGRVKSVSGHTGEVLGTPTISWLVGDSEV